MLRRFSLLGAVMLTLSLGLSGCQPASATDTAVVSDRPAVSELEAVLAELKAIGDYEFWFGDTDLPLTAEWTPYYEEYNYLHRLVTDTQALITYYDDAGYLEQHQLQPSIFQDVVDEAHSAIRGLPLLLNLQRKTPSTTPATPTTSTPATSTPASTNKITPSTPATITVVNPTVASTTSQATPAPTATETTDPESTMETAEDTIIVEDAPAVPATGEVTEDEKHQISWPALIAVTITGAAVASIVIALVIRDAPRRPAARRRRH